MAQEIDEMEAQAIMRAQMRRAAESVWMFEPAYQAHQQAQQRLRAAQVEADRAQAAWELRRHQLERASTGGGNG